MTIFTRAFWRYAGERAIKTFAQVLLASLTVGDAVPMAGIEEMPWLAALSIAAAATLISVLTSITAYTGPSQEATQRVTETAEDIRIDAHGASADDATMAFPTIGDEPHAPISTTPSSR